jgi:hypothetical protein
MKDGEGSVKQKMLPPERIRACPATVGSTFSMFVQLNHIYENIRFDFYHRACDGRVPGFLRAEERRANGCFDFNDNPRHLDDQEELDDQEDVDCFDRSLAGREEEGDH